MPRVDPTAKFRRDEIVESRQLDQNTVMDIDAGGHRCAVTFGHASDRTDVQHLTVEGIAA